MTTITIRNVPDEVRDQLADRASRMGRSMQSYLLDLLAETATRPTQAEIIDRARARVAASSSRITTADILEARDAERR